MPDQPSGDPQAGPGAVDAVPGRGLLREVATMSDGRRITYYWARPANTPSRPEEGAS